MLTAAAWGEREEPFSHDAYDGGLEEVVDIDRGGPLLLTAPHAVNHHGPRGQPKVADVLTGGLAVLLAEHLDASVIVSARRVPPWSTWSERTDPFARALAGQLDRGRARLIVDLHGMLDRHGVDVCIGLGPQPGAQEKRLADDLVSDLPALQVSRDRPFSARGAWTVTAHAQAVGVSAVQLEIARRHRDPMGAPQAAEHLLNGLARLLRRYS